MEGPRAVRPEEYQETIDLLNSVFRRGAACAVEQEYPMILGRPNMENMRVVVEDGRVVSHAATYPADILLDGSGKVPEGRSEALSARGQSV